jgi:hypothetical protein
MDSEDSLPDPKSLSDMVTTSLSPRLFVSLPMSSETDEKTNSCQALDALLKSCFQDFKERYGCTPDFVNSSASASSSSKTSAGEAAGLNEYAKMGSVVGAVGSFHPGDAEARIRDLLVTPSPETVAAESIQVR